MGKRFTDGDDNVTLGRKDDSVDALGGNDTVSAGDGNDTVSGGTGDDLLLGQGGNDNLYGDAGDDVLLGGVGTNLLEGGNGVDAVDYSWYGTSEPVYVNLAAGFAVDQVGLNGAAPTAGTGQTFNDTIFGVENVVGAPNTTNWLVGDVGNNQLTGGSLADRLEGAAGSDTLQGGAGNDSLVGGTGTDVLIGGAGADSFYFTGGDGPALGLTDPPADHSQWQFYQGSVDLITDFDASDRIVIQVHNNGGFSLAYDAGLNETFIVYSADGSGTAGIIVTGDASSQVGFEVFA